MWICTSPNCIFNFLASLLGGGGHRSVEWEILIYVGEWNMGLATYVTYELGFTLWQNVYFQSNTRTVQILVLKKSLLCCLCLLKYANVFWLANKHIFYLHIRTHSSLSSIFVYLEHTVFLMHKLDLKFHWHFYMWCYPHRITVIHCLELSKIKNVVVQVVQQSNCEQTAVSKRLCAGYCAFAI